MKTGVIVILFFALSPATFSQVRKVEFYTRDEKLKYDTICRFFIEVSRSLEDNDLVTLSIDSVEKEKGRLFVSARPMYYDTLRLRRLKLYVGEKISKRWPAKYRIVSEVGFTHKNDEIIFDVRYKRENYLILQCFGISPSCGVIRVR